MRRGRLHNQNVQKALHQIENNRNGCFDLGDLLNQSGAIGRLLEVSEVLAQKIVRLAQTHLAQRVQLRTPAPAKRQIRQDEQIELASKRVCRSASTIRDVP